MTRSVEIPEEAVEAGAKAYYDYNSYADVEPDWSVWAAKDGEEAAIYRNAARIVLAAALPYLAPAAADLVMTKEAHDFLANWKYNDVRISTDEAIAETMRLMKPSYPPAAVGDGGLREALAELAAEWERQPSSYLQETARLLQDLLRFHPAAPAVPQPATRKKLTRTLSDVIGQWDGDLPEATRNRRAAELVREIQPFLAPQPVERTRHAIWRAVYAAATEQGLQPSGVADKATESVFALSAQPVDREALAKAWDEGHSTGWKNHQDGNYGNDYWDDRTPNPYRLAGEQEQVEK